MVTPIPLVPDDRVRTVAKEADTLLRNRYIEPNPALNEGQLSYISRPGLKRLAVLGNGPVRAIYQQPGTFDDDIFVVSDDVLYRLKRDGTSSVIFTGLAGSAGNTSVRMAATGDVGDVRPHLFFCDGAGLFVYTEDGVATSTLTGTAFANGDVVRVGSIYYKYTSGSVDTGTPAGTSGSPWLLKLAGTVQANYDVLVKAINASGTPGTDYSTLLTVFNPDISGLTASAPGVKVGARVAGVTGAGLPTTTTGAGLTWSTATTTGGTSANVVPVATPDNVGVIDVGYINNFVIVIPAQGQGINGRFYWIQPAAIAINAIDFATAERSPDPIYQVVVFNDQFWLPGQSSTEAWFMTGDATAPMERLQGVVFDRGTFPGTAIQIKNFMVVIDSDGGVFKIQGGETRISTPDIAERLRKAVNELNILP